MTAPWTLSLRGLTTVATVSERYSAFNVEMVEVIGGRFWKPYASVDAERARVAAAPGAARVGLYEQRPPLDLAVPRLRLLAAALGPSYCRVSGTWANDVYFHDGPGPAPAEPPPGFGGVLTRQQWQGVLAFCEAVDAPLVTSFAVSDGVRAADGSWVPDQARALLEATRDLGGRIVAAELMNEPTFAALGHAPEGFDAARFGRDVAAFRELLAQVAPEVLVLGPGSAGEGSRRSLLPPGLATLTSPELLEATDEPFDVFSYHFYGAISERVAAGAPELGTTVADALSPGWLARTDESLAHYAGLRDRYAPGAPIWNTETAQAAAGGDRWAATFVDSFRFLYQLGSLARAGVDAVFHNTLCASDYGLVDEATLEPRPNYWAALLWRRLMGRHVHAVEPAPDPALHVFVHDARQDPAATAALVLNTGATASTVELAEPAARFTLTAPELTATAIELNGQPLRLEGGELPDLAARGEPVRPGPLRLPPVSVTFLVTAGRR